MPDQLLKGEWLEWMRWNEVNGSLVYTHTHIQKICDVMNFAFVEDVHALFVMVSIVEIPLTTTRLFSYKNYSILVYVYSGWLIVLVLNFHY